MARKLLAVFSMGLMTFALTGCASDQAVFRGQCPPAAGMYGDCNACPPGGGMYAGAARGGRMARPNPRQAMMAHRQAKLQQAYAIQAQRQANGGHHLNLPFHPVHRNYVDYRAPRNLSYPENNTPAATVQYPYYTVRGPTDFFYDD